MSSVSSRSSGASFIEFRRTSHEIDTLGDCALCREELDETKETLLEHIGGGHQHPIHKRCLKILFEKNINNCLLCRVKLDPGSILTWQNKCIIQINAAKELVQEQAAIQAEIDESRPPWIFGFGLLGLTVCGAKEISKTYGISFWKALIPLFFIAALIHATVHYIFDLRRRQMGS